MRLRYFLLGFMCCVVFVSAAFVARAAGIAFLGPKPTPTYAPECRIDAHQPPTSEGVECYMTLLSHGYIICLEDPAFDEGWRTYIPVRPKC